MTAEITQVLSRMEQGDPSAAEQLLPLVYDSLRRLAAAKIAGERPGQTLQATALVHEAYLRLVDGGNDQSWDSRGHFFAAAAEAMRRILVDRARHRATSKAGGPLVRMELAAAEPTSDEPEVELLALDDALQRLTEIHPRKAEVVKLRYFAGLTIPQVASVLGIAASTADLDWAFARSWLRVEMSDAGHAAVRQEQK